MENNSLERRRLLTIASDNLAKSAVQLSEIEVRLNALTAVVDDFIRRQPKQ